MALAAILPFVGPLLGLIDKVVDKAIPDKDAAEKLKATFRSEMLNFNVEELKSATSVIVAEAQGESWLQRNWRPILMLVCIYIVANNYILAPYVNLMFGVNVGLDLPERLWDLITLGVGGYVGGRTVEKVASIWKKSQV